MRFGVLAGWLADELEELKPVSGLAEGLAGWSRVLTRSMLREVGGYLIPVRIHHMYASGHTPWA